MLWEKYKKKFIRLSICKNQIDKIIERENSIIENWNVNNKVKWVIIKELDNKVTSKGSSRYSLKIWLKNQKNLIKSKLSLLKIWKQNLK